MKPEAKTSEKSLQDVEKIISGLDKNIRSKKLYASNNPTLIRHREELQKALNLFLEQQPSLKLIVDPFEILVDGEVVYQNDKRQENFAFKLFNDGIRSITFLNGISPPELDGFFAALIQTQKHDEEESYTDTVSALWEKEFEHIKYAIADTLVSDLPEEGEKSTDEKLLEITSPTLEHYHGTGETSRADDDDDFYQAMNVTINPVSVGKMFQDKTVLDVAELTKIKQDILECEKPERLLLDFVDMVLAVLMEEHDKDSFMKFIEYLGQALENTLMQNQLNLSRVLMELIRKFPVKPVPVLVAHPSAMKDVLNQLWTPHRLQLLLLAINHAPENMFEDIETLLTHLSSPAGSYVFQNLSSIADLSRKKTACRGLVRLQGAEIHSQINSWIFSKDLEQARLGLYILSLLKSEHIVEYIPKLIQHPDPTIKKEGLSLLKKCSGSKTNEILLGLLSDKDADLRMTALRILSGVKDKEMIQKIGATILSSQFHQLPLNERRAYFLTIAKMAGDDILPFLQGIFETRDWFGNQTLKELSICASFALVTINSDKSKLLIKNILEHGNKSARQALESVIKARSEGSS